VQLLQNDIVETVKKALDDTELEPRNLTLEVTESLAIKDMSRMQTILSRIRALGARIALDDFGTGYSSLNHIREIPLDVIKVDQSFVRDLSTDSYSQSFIRMVSDLGNTIDKRICVEGIEMEDQYRILEKMNVRLVQGFYFDKPMHLGEFEEKYVENGVVQNEENELKDQKVPKTAVKRTHSEAKKKAVK
jgi:EAL domain-containing protein (putative c-di-GMP-specific phosphodiesterase class I)